jgi:hypothetical protein
MITDGKFGDTPAHLRAVLTNSRVTQTHILNPNGAKRAIPLDDPALAEIRVLPLGDANPQAITFGHIIAEQARS